MSQAKPSFLFWLLALSLLIGVSHAETRKWTNSKGQVISAEYISSDGTKVKLRFKGKVIEYDIGKLSEADRKWISEHEKKAEPSASEASQDTAKPKGQATGRRENVPIDKRYFGKEADYFKGKNRRDWIKEHENGAGQSTGKLESWLKRDPEKDKCIIYCPPSYDGSEAYGILLYVSYGDAMLPQEWNEVLDKHKLIAVSADAVGNHVKGQGQAINPHPYRVSLSMDAMSVVERDYKIDPARRYVCGTSGGGHMAFTCAALYPELFKGAISSAAQSYLPGHFPGFAVRDFKSGDRKKLKWIVVSGSKDFNYNAILETSAVWEKNRLNYRFLDVPGMGHDILNAKSLEEALNWIDEGNKKKDSRRS